MEERSRRQIIEDLQKNVSSKSEQTQSEQAQPEDDKLLKTFEAYQDEELSSFVSDMKHIRERLDSSFEEMLDDVQRIDELDEGGVDIDAMRAESRKRIGLPTRQQRRIELSTKVLPSKLSSNLPTQLAEMLSRMNDLLKSQLDKVVANEENAPIDKQLNQLKLFARTYIAELDKISV